MRCGDDDALAGESTHTVLGDCPADVDPATRWNERFAGDVAVVACAYCVGSRLMRWPSLNSTEVQPESPR